MIALLNKVMEIEGANKCTLQFFDNKKEILYLIAQKGFSQDFEEHFKEVKPFDGSSCGRAIGVGIPIVVNDTMLDIAFLPHLEIIKKEGYRAVKSQPIIDEAGKKVGVVSTHFDEPKWSWDNDSLDGVISELGIVLSRLSGSLKPKVVRR